MRHRSRQQFTRATRMLTSVVVAVLALTGLAVAAPTVAQAATTAYTLTAPASVHLGSSATMKATWFTKGTGATGSVSLQRRSGTSWIKVATVKLVKGKGSVTIKPSASTTYRLRSSAHTSASKRVTVVRSWITFGPTSASIKVGSSATMSASVVIGGAKVARPLVLQRRSGSSWVTVKTVAVAAAGSTFTVAPTSTTTYRLVRYSVVSPSRTVTVDRDWASLKFSATSLPSSGTSTTASVVWYAAGKKANGTITLQQRSGSGAWSTAASVKVADGVGSVAIKPAATRTYRLLAGSTSSPSVTVTVKVVIPTAFTIKGSGWGHGIGMSQYGAYGMALDGYSATEIVKHYYTGVAVTPTVMPTSPLQVQVFGPGKTSSAGDRKTSVAIDVHDGGWRVRNNQIDPATGTAGMTTAYGTSDQEVVFSVVGENVRASIDGKAVAEDSVLRLHWDSTTYYHPKSTTQTYATVAGAQGSYRHGRLTVRSVGGKINVVNDLLLNTEYLYGIGEMPSSWGVKGPAALAAQAITARSYAKLKYDAGTQSWCSCNLVDDTRDQNFVGWKKENEGSKGYYGKIWQAAVNSTVSGTSATSGLLVTYDGKPIATHYASSSGGATISAKDAWGGSGVPYEQSVDDHWSLDPATGNTYRSWTATLTQAQARAYFGLANVASVKVSARYKGGAAKTLTAVAADGTTVNYTDVADDIRTSLNDTATGYVRSAYVDFTPVLP
ncbi:MAG: SpoIID/LytB domain-containing protein [Brevundimonas sp.]